MESNKLKRRVKSIKTTNDIFEPISSEELKKWKEERIERKKKLSLEFQLGFYIGEYIVHKKLPTLSTDMLTSRKVIKVSEEDTKENERLDKEWYETTEYGSKKGEENIDVLRKDAWEKYKENNEMLKKKYLPNPLVCYLPFINVVNLEELKKGIKTSLWDCDMCSYNTDDDKIKIYDDKEGFFTIVEFEL